jgi:hypothetical protein
MPAHPILLALITITILGEEYKPCLIDEERFVMPCVGNLTAVKSRSQLL